MKRTLLLSKLIPILSWLLWRNCLLPPHRTPRSSSSNPIRPSKGARHWMYHPVWHWKNHSLTDSLICSVEKTRVDYFFKGSVVLDLFPISHRLIASSGQSSGLESDLSKRSPAWVEISAAKARVTSILTHERSSRNLIKGRHTRIATDCHFLPVPSFTLRWC